MEKKHLAIVGCTVVTDTLFILQNCFYTDPAVPLGALSVVFGLLFITQCMLMHFICAFLCSCSQDRIKGELRLSVQ